MKVVICCHNFSKDNLRLMPWRYIHDMAKGIQQAGHDITVFSFGASIQGNDEKIDGIAIYHTTVRRIFTVWKQKLMEADCVIWSSSPLTVFYHWRFRSLGKPFILLFTGPFYSFLDIFRAHIHHISWKQLSSHYKNALIPLKWTAGLVNAEYVKSAVVLSRKNHNELGKVHAPEFKIKTIPPGYACRNVTCADENSIEVVRDRLGLPRQGKIILYLGSLYEIRGINILLQAFREVQKKENNVSLLLLVRTDSAEEVDSLATRVEQLGLAGKTIIKAGFLANDTVQNYLYASDVVALPFLLVPADMPVAALEAMALGKPVITTVIDGMPEMVEGRGLVVKPGSANELAEAIQRLCREDELSDRLQRNCLEYMAQYPSPEDVTQKFLALINDDEER